MRPSSQSILFLVRFPGCFGGIDPYATRSRLRTDPGGLSRGGRASKGGGWPSVGHGRTRRQPVGKKSAKRSHDSTTVDERLYEHDDVGVDTGEDPPGLSSRDAGKRGQIYGHSVAGRDALAGRDAGEAQSEHRYAHPVVLPR